MYTHEECCAFICMCERHNIVVVGSCVYACVCRFVMILFNQGLNYYFAKCSFGKICLDGSSSS